MRTGSAEKNKMSDKRKIPLTVVLEGTKVILGEVEVDLDSFEYDMEAVVKISPAQIENRAIGYLFGDGIAGNWVCFRTKLPDPN